MKKRLSKIMVLVALTIAACISAFKAVPPETAKAETTENLFQAKSAGVTVIDSDVFLETGFDGYKSGDTVEENAVYAFMRTKDYSKYQKAAAGFSFRSGNVSNRIKLTTGMSSNLMYQFTAASIKSALSAYCDDVTLSSKNVDFSDSSQNNDNYFISTSPLLDLSYYAYMRAPSDLDAKYYYYSVKLYYTRDLFANSDRNVYFNEILTSSAVSFPKEIASTRALIYDWLERCDMRANLEYIKVFQQKLGIYTGNESMPVKVKYKYAAGFADIREKEETFTMNSLYAQQKDTAKYLMYRSLEGKDDITSFNCVYEDYLLYNDENRELVAKTGEKILLQAKDIEYEYDGCESATLTVTYEPFQYSNFGIRVKSNDPAQNLSVDLYSADVSTTESGAYYTLTFNYSALSGWLKNKCGWLVTLNRESFEATGVIADNNEATPLTVTVGDKALTVGFYKTDQNALVNLRICVIAEIIPDHTVDYKVKYKKLTIENGNIVESDEEASGSMMYSGYINLSTFANFMSYHGDTVNGAVKLYDADNSESAVKYYEPYAVACTVAEYNSETGKSTAAITVRYTYYSIFRVNVNGNFSHYAKATSGVPEYKIKDLGYTVPEGYRIGAMTCGIGGAPKFDDAKPQDASVVFNTVFNSKTLADVNVVDVNLTVTDEWVITVNYLKPYKDSGFATMDSVTKTIKIADAFACLSDPEAAAKPTEEELKKFLGVGSLTVIGELGTYDSANTKVEKTGNGYEITLAYWYATLKKIEASGEADFMNVPLTNYKAWCDGIGKDWGLLALNTEEKEVFKSNGDIQDYSTLYGYFYVAVFKEQVKDLNSLFSGYSAGGCRTFFQAKKVNGSDFYKFCRSFGSFNFLFAGAAATAEVFNDDNGTYYSYFSFIDGSSNLSYAANNRADDYFDNSTAFDNTVEDVKDDISSWWKNSDFAKLAKIFLGIAGGAFVLLLILRIVPVFVRAVGKIGTTVEEVKPKSKKNKKR